MAGEDLLFFLSLSFLAPFCSLASKLPLLHYSLSFKSYFVGTKEGEEEREEAGSPLRQVAVQLAHVITRERADHEGASDPYCAAIGFYVPRVRVITSHTLHFHSLFFFFYPHWFYFQPTNKARKKICFSFKSLCLLYARSKKLKVKSCVKFQGTLGHKSPDKRQKRRGEPIKINSLSILHSFPDKQQLHKMGNKYYLCNRKTIRHH